MTQDFAGKNILLGLSGGIAAYKSALLVRELKRFGAEVRVVMTNAATEFITPLTLQALSGSPARVGLFDGEAEHAMGHIELARWADYVVVAPASANCLAKMAHGIADDLLSTILLVSECPVIVCPGMNRSMWTNAATAANCELLAQRGVLFVGPAEGEQACGEYGFGRMSEVADIITALRLHDVHGLLLNQHVVITAGPTREAIDPVRFIGNHSSGKMGYALAEAAKHAGALVTLISGPVALPAPTGMHVVHVDSAIAMREAVLSALTPGAIFIGAAAVADYRLDETHAAKIKKRDHAALSLMLVPNPDILFEVADSEMASFVVGFAAETTDLMHNAREKLERKKTDMIVANWVGDGRGFEQDNNEVMVLTRSTEHALPLMHKTRLASQLIKIITTSFHDKMMTKSG